MQIRKSLFRGTIALLSLGVPTVAGAEEPPTFADRPDEDFRESDRAFGVFLNPLAMATGVFGAEADFVLGRYGALAIEGGLYRQREGVSVATGLGLVAYPGGSPLHGLYIEPRTAYAYRWGDPLFKFDWSTHALGLGLTVGWQWTWDYGLSLRIGGGAMCFLGGQRPEFTQGPLSLGVEPVLDGAIGWAF